MQRRDVLAGGRECAGDSRGGGGSLRAKPENIFIFATHTHSGPAPQTESDWDRPLAEIVADAIVQAYESRADARLAAGFGQLFGYNINRRWLNRPADPSVGVLRVDRADGTPLAVLGNYACHAVVLGYDNLLISADWPGYASRMIEADLGHDCVVLFSQGGSGDVNPLTETVRQKLAAGIRLARLAVSRPTTAHTAKPLRPTGGTLKIAAAAHSSKPRRWHGLKLPKSCASGAA